VPRLRVYAHIASTNTLALRLAARDAPHGTTIIADEQTAGRGRRGRRWIAPGRAAVLLSIVVRPAGPVMAGATPVRVGAIVARTIETLTGLPARVKWPNDVLAPGGAKLAGVLCEGVMSGERDGFVIVGIGINVDQAPHEFTTELRDQATSLRVETGSRIDRARIAGELVRALLEPPSLAAPLLARERADIEQRHALHGEPVTVDDTFAGTVTGIAADGGLIVVGPAGARTVRNGTIRHAANFAAAQPLPRYDTGQP
jgi:BirA family transcriptional regulator, biotin operon repressor / biotin---[acetyl-CoA-carboxylase] ligase